MSVGVSGQGPGHGTAAARHIIVISERIEAKRSARDQGLDLTDSRAGFQPAPPVQSSTSIPRPNGGAWEIAAHDAFRIIPSIGNACEAVR